MWTGRNPSLGPIEKAPFYAVRLYPGDIGAATGFATDADARVQDGSGRAIDGLYAAGNDMQSAMGGVYPAPGITLGPGLVFAYLAARHAAARARGEQAESTDRRAAA
jgi:predicted oxidoreductase